MIVKLVKYIKNNDWKTIQADWRECRELKRRYRILEKDATLAMENICCDKEQYLQNDMLLKCIREPSRECFELYNLDGAYSHLSFEYCPRFSKQDMPVACQKRDCPYVGLNRQYCDAVKRYQDCAFQKKNFWNEKFAARSK